MSKTKAWIKRVLMTAVVVMAMFFLVSVYFLRMTVFIDKKNTKSYSERFLKDNGVDVEEIEQNFRKKSEKISLKSRHGHNISVQYVLADGSYDKTTVVLVHGHEMNLISMYPIARLLLENGINVVLYDQRAHGDNTAKNVTFGYYGKDDLEDVVNLVVSRMKVNSPIGLLGQSMGAATCGFYIGSSHANKYIKFAVLDCPYNNMKSVIKVAAEKRGYNETLTNILLANLSILNKIYLGFWHSDMDVSKVIRHSDVPVLMYAMEKDRTCPIYMAEDIFSNIKHANKDIVRFKRGGHIKGFYKERDVYVSKLLEFVERYGR